MKLTGIGRSAIVLACLSASMAVFSEPVDWSSLAKQRAQERWNFLIEGRLESAYNYFSPAQQKLTSYRDFQKKIKGVGLWKSAEVKNATCVDDRCNVATKLFIETRHPMIKGAISTDADISEVWIIDHENHQVWFMPNN